MIYLSPAVAAAFAAVPHEQWSSAGTPHTPTIIDRIPPMAEEQRPRGHHIDDRAAQVAALRQQEPPVPFDVIATLLDYPSATSARTALHRHQTREARHAAD